MHELPHVKIFTYRLCFPFPLGRHERLETSRELSHHDHQISGRGEGGEGGEGRGRGVRGERQGGRGREGGQTVDWQRPIITDMLHQKQNVPPAMMV